MGNSLCVYFVVTFFIDFDGYHIVRTEEGQPRPKIYFQ